MEYGESSCIGRAIVLPCMVNSPDRHTVMTRKCFGLRCGFMTNRLFAHSPRVEVRSYCQFLPALLACLPRSTLRQDWRNPRPIVARPWDAWHLMDDLHLPVVQMTASGSKKLSFLYTKRVMFCTSQTRLSGDRTKNSAARPWCGLKRRLLGAVCILPVFALEICLPRSLDLTALRHSSGFTKFCGR